MNASSDPTGARPAAADAADAPSERSVAGPIVWIASSVLEGANRFADTTAVQATLRCSDAAAPAGFVERLARSLPALDAALREVATAFPPRGGLATATLVAAIAQRLQEHVDCRSERSGAAPGPEPGTFVAAAVSEYPDIGTLALGLAARLVADAWTPVAMGPQAAPNPGAMTAPVAMGPQAAPNPGAMTAPVAMGPQAAPNPGAMTAPVATGPQAAPNPGAMTAPVAMGPQAAPSSGSATGAAATPYLDVLQRVAAAQLPEPVRRAIARVARARGVNVERVSRNPDIFRLGTGHWQRRCDWMNTTTPMVYADMTANKPLSGALQRKMAVPYPRQMTAGSAERAVEAAQAIGYPVVVKPWRGRGGHGVSANLVDEAEVRAAFARAVPPSSRGQVIVEQFLPGDDYRLLYIRGQYVAAAKRLPPQVVGDGERTINELVDEVNRTRNRPDGFWTTLHDYKIDGDSLRLLAAAGLTPESVPAAGRTVILSSAANGGKTSDATAIMHPDNIAAGARAARVAGMDVCGVDFLLPDPRRSYKETGGGICEVNYNPAAEIHIIADDGCHLEVVEKFVDWILPPPARGRIPLAVLFGAPAGVAALVVHLLGVKGVATSSREGVRYEDYAVTDAPAPWPAAARLALLDPGARQCVLEASGRDLAQHGLFSEWCDVVALGDPALAIDDGQRIALRVASTVVAWDDGLAAAAAALAAKSVIACSERADSAALAAHLGANGRAVTIDGATLSLCEGEHRRAAAIANHGDASLALAAAVAWGLGESPEAILDRARALAADVAAPPRYGGTQAP